MGLSLEGREETGFERCGDLRGAGRFFCFERSVVNVGGGGVAKGMGKQAGSENLDIQGAARVLGVEM